MKTKHIFYILIIILVVLASRECNKLEDEVIEQNEKEHPDYNVKGVPIKATKVKTIGDDNERMILYAYSDTISTKDAVAWCEELKRTSSKAATTHHVLFDEAKNAIPPTVPMFHVYGTEENRKRHIRAYYVYRKYNGLNESYLILYETNMWESTSQTCQWLKIQ